ncbi:McrB family protein [Haladaptatus litoreus]|nr:AAA family ATPase [Haladaptatus litoreus]
MAPSRDTGGGKRYEALRDADVGDIVVHYLQDKQTIVGVSTIESELEEDFDGPPTGRWTERQEQEGGYLRWLTNYQELDSPIAIYDDILHNPVFEDRLRQIREEEEKILYSKNLSINQGHYFTRCPSDLVEILAEASSDLADQLADRGVEGVVDQSTEPADSYDGIVSATEDIRSRLEQQTGEQNWLGEQVAETIVADWTEALRRSNLIKGKVTGADAVKCDQIIQLYEDNTNRLAEQAATIGSATIQKSNLSADQVLFTVLLRDLQEEIVGTSNMNHVKFDKLLKAVHRGAQESEELPSVAEQPANTETITRQLQRAKQVVFYGPPGTGKTYTARQFARWWLHQHSPQSPTTDQLEVVTFHPSFSYEDFIEGLTAEANDGAVEYRIEEGVFKRICQRAQTAYDYANQQEDTGEAPPYVLIIDEINRGNLAQIFGEVITLLEADKRGNFEIELAHSGESFTIPPNLYVIGTMNTADQSIALVDTALRRRFRFIDFPPDLDIIFQQYETESPDAQVAVTGHSSGITRRERLLGASVLATYELNERILNAPQLGKGKQLGHTYFLNHNSSDDIVDAWRYDILPQLEEYYFGQFDRLRDELLNETDTRLIDWETERIQSFDAQALYSALCDLAGAENPALLVDAMQAMPDGNGTGAIQRQPDDAWAAGDRTPDTFRERIQSTLDDDSVESMVRVLDAGEEFGFLDAGRGDGASIMLKSDSVDPRVGIIKLSQDGKIDFRWNWLLDVDTNSLTRKFIEDASRVFTDVSGYKHRWDPSMRENGGFVEPRFDVGDLSDQDITALIEGLRSFTERAATFQHD